MIQPAGRPANQMLEGEGARRQVESGGGSGRGYVHFVQDIADTKHSITVKYDWYNPNTDINSSAIGTALTADQIAANKLTPNASKPFMAANKTDMSYSTIGIGYIYRMNNNIKLTVYYDMVTNGKTMLKNYMADLTDNVLTVRMQYKF